MLMNSLFFGWPGNIGYSAMINHLPPFYDCGSFFMLIIILLSADIGADIPRGGFCLF